MIAFNAQMAAHLLGLLFSFDGAAGGPPAGFSFSSTEGVAADGWKVEKTDKVLSRTAPKGYKGTARAITLADGPANVIAAVKVKLGASKGQAGMVWRFKDLKNHYVAVLSARDRTLRFDRVVDGVTTNLAVQTIHELAPKEWTDLKVQQNGKNAKIYLGKHIVLMYEDASHQGPGKVGVVAEGAGGASFRDFVVEEVPPKVPAPKSPAPASAPRP